MFIGDSLIAHGLVTQADITAALEQQRVLGVRLGETLVAMGRLSAADLAAVLQAIPPAPLSLEDTGIDLLDLLNLLTKVLHVRSADTFAKVSEVLKLPANLVEQLVNVAREHQLIELSSLATGGTTWQMRFALSTKGREWAHQALEQSAYVGPVPVKLSDYVARIQSQSIGDERVSPPAVERALSNLVMSNDLARQVGPAINAGRSILLYGPPGNGKTSVGERIGQIFDTVVYIPYCFEVEGQIIKVFDPAVHKEIIVSAVEQSKGHSIRMEESDTRWVACRRPFIATGGELTLEMLDLDFDATMKFYEAPLHVKALNGTFMIDDFGRQMVPPGVLLNRWIVPMESRMDHLKLHTGKSFSLPFDGLVIFSTNLPLSQLMDPAFARRIPYKIEVPPPGREEYRQIFNLAARAQGLEPSKEVIDFVISELTERNNFPLAGYQPGFIVTQVLAACKYGGVAPAFHRDMLTSAIKNLYPRNSPQPQG